MDNTNKPKEKKQEIKPDISRANQSLTSQGLSVIGDRLMREKEVFRLLGISDSTGQQMRLKGQGPKFVKIGRMVRYRESDVLEYIQDLETHTSTSAVDNQSKEEK